MSNPVSAYRAQQGLADDAMGSVNPTLLSWIKLASKQTGADPVALLATSLQESGGQLNGKAGDNGTSFGPFQFHIGGALGKHSPAWASTYPAVLNRAQEFARLNVRGGRGAAAVQRPLDRRLYAQGVDSLMARAHAILEGAGGASAVDPLTPSPRTPAKRVYAESRPAAALDILDADTAEGALAAFQRGQRKTAVAPTASSVPNPALPLASPAGFGTPSSDWGGSHGIAKFYEQIGLKNGLKAVSEKRARMHTSSGGVSDHWTGSTNSYAYDLSNGSAPTPQMDATAAEIAASLGVPNWKGGVLNVNKNGFRVQLLYRTHVGGNHFNHVHVGVKKL